MSNDFNDKWTDIGALWKSKKGTGFNGKIKIPEGMKGGDELKINVFTNNKNGKESRPDLKIFTPKEEQQPDEPIAPPPDIEGDDSIPF